MRTQAIFLAIILVLVSPFAYAQWVQTNGPYGHYEGGINCFAVSGTNLFAGTSGGVFLSTNNGTIWTAVDSGLTNTWVSCLAASGTNVYAGTGHGFFLFTHNGTSWNAVDSGLTNRQVRAFAVSGGNFFVGTWGGGVFVTTNNCTSWSEVDSGLADLCVTSLAVNGTNLLAGTWYGGLFRSTNNGINWTYAHTGLIYHSVGALAVSGTNLLAATAPGKDASFGLSLSTNNGTSWTVIDSATWKSCFAVRETLVAAGGRTELIFSTDCGGSWKAVDNGQLVNVQAVAITGSYLLVSEGNGVWRRLLSEVVTSVNPVTSDLPHEFLLRQNYPNPFNPSTTIRYELPHSSRVSLNVYNTLGEEVATPVNGEKPAGVYTVQFNGSALASGVYFYRLQAEDYVASKKMLVLK